MAALCKYYVKSCYNNTQKRSGKMNQIADNWKDYECIDAGNGEKLERWNDVILRRAMIVSLHGNIPMPTITVPAKAEEAGSF